MTSLSQRIEDVRRRIDSACVRAGRRPEDVELMLVSKTVERERIDEAIAAGHTLFGENRVQEIVAKFSDGVPPQVRVHLIGHLQTNKVKAVLPLVDAVHSVDRTSLVEEIEKRSGDASIDAYLQVNTSGESSKFGVSPGETRRLAERMAASSSLRLRGLMTIALFDADEERVRSCFRLLRELRDDLVERGIADSLGLSMGMSSDFEAAIEEGATVVRVGTTVFGRRDTPDSAYWPPNP